MIKNLKNENEEIYEFEKKEEKKINFPEKIIENEFSNIEKWIFLIQNNEFIKTNPKSFYI